MDFPQALRTVRHGRRLSQLELALRAGTTQRHVSFLESGRSSPGRALVIRLAEAMELSLRERNDLLHAAEFAPVYPQTALDDPALLHVRSALDHILTGHLPYPAIVVDADHTLVLANDAFSLFTDGVADKLLEPPPSDFRDELAAYVPYVEPGPEHVGFAAPMQLRSAGGILHLTTTITTFATALDVTVAELKLEAFLPADAATAALLTKAE